MILQARTGDPTTSHEAMARFDRQKMVAAVECVVALYQEYGPMADYELRERFAEAWTEPCCDHLYRQARSTARDQGRIRNTGLETVNPATRRRQIVWEACVVEPPAIDHCPTCGKLLRNKEAA